MESYSGGLLGAGSGPNGDLRHTYAIEGRIR
jgi:hypothetical protein